MHLALLTFLLARVILRPRRPKDPKDVYQSGSPVPFRPVPLGVRGFNDSEIRLFSVCSALTMDSFGISRGCPQLFAKSSQRGFTLSMSAIFFARVQPLSLRSRFAEARGS